MRARLVLITALCGAVFLAGACQQDTAGPRHTGASASGSQQTTTEATSTTASPTSTTASPTTVRKVFDHQAMETSVLRVLADDYGIDRVQQVTCPPGKEVVDGSTFQCTAVIGGEAKRIKITVRGNDGEYMVSGPG